MNDSSALPIPASRLELQPSVAASAFTGALALAANGVSIVATDGPAGRAGLTVSSMCSVCAEPPLVLACVSAENEFCKRTAINRVFSINILSAVQTALSNVFAGLSDDPEEDRFLHGAWHRGITGAPLLDTALVSLDCVFDSSSTHGTHVVHIGRVVGITTREGDALVYSRRRYTRTSDL